MLIILILFSCIYVYKLENNKITQDYNQYTCEYMNELFDENKILSININIDENEFEELKKNAKSEQYCKADIEINGETYHNIGIRPKGNSSLVTVLMDDSTDRYSFKIKADEYVENQKIHGLSEFVLNNNICDATNMKEYLSYSMLKEMKVKTPGFAYAHININNKYWGFYLAVESLGDEFLKRNFQDTKGNLYKVETTINHDGFKESQDFMEMIGLTVSGGDLVYTGEDESNYGDIFNNAVTKTVNKDDHKALIKIIKNLNEGNNLEEYINVDEVLRYFAVNTFLVNLDSYASNMKHNYYIYERNGKMEVLPWDYNLSFGGYYLEKGSDVINFPIDTPVTHSVEKSPLIMKLLEVPEYKEKYHQYLKEIVNFYTENDRYKNIINNLDNLIGEEIKNDPTAFYNYDQYQKAVYNLGKYFKERSNSIIQQLENKQPSDRYGNAECDIDLEAMGSEIPGITTFLKSEEKAKLKGIDEGKIISIMMPDLINGEIAEESYLQLKQLGLTDEQITIIENALKPNLMFGNSEVGISNENVQAISNVNILEIGFAAIILALIFVIKFNL